MLMQISKEVPIMQREKSIPENEMDPSTKLAHSKIMVELQHSQPKF